MHISLKTSERHKVDPRVMKERIDENHPWVTDDVNDLHHWSSNSDIFELIIRASAWENGSYDIKIKNLDFNQVL